MDSSTSEARHCFIAVVVTLGRIISGPSLHLSAGVRAALQKGATRVSRFFQAGGLVRP
jgi:hypothetical protein